MGNIPPRFLPPEDGMGLFDPGSQCTSIGDIALVQSRHIVLLDVDFEIIGGILSPLEKLISGTSGRALEEHKMFHLICLFGLKPNTPVENLPHPRPPIGSLGALASFVK